MDNFMNWLMSWMSNITKLGGGKSWQVGNVTVQLWPFVGLAICVALMVIYDLTLA